LIDVSQRDYLFIGIENKDGNAQFYNDILLKVWGNHFAIVTSQTLKVI